MKKIALLLSIVLGPLTVLAANEVTHTGVVTLVLPSDSTEYTLEGHSKFDSLKINNANFEFVLSTGGKISILSAGKKNLKSSVAGTFVCGASQSSIYVDAQPDSTTVTITPSGSCTTSGGSGSTGGGGGIISSGGGGGGGGGSSVVSAPTVAAAEPVVTPISQTPVVSPPTIVEPAQVAPTAPAPTAVFEKDLFLGVENNDVTRLQLLLSGDKEVYPEAKVTGYYGSLTKRAVERFQEKYGVASAGVLGFGRLGPKTRAKLAEVFGGEAPIAMPKAPEVAQPSPVATAVSPVFDKSLYLGLSSPDVKRLQQLLNSDSDTWISASGVGSTGNETNYFGKQTENAVKKFQDKYDLAKVGDPGYGYVGPKTRAKLNEVFGAAVTPTPPPPAPAPSETSQGAAPASLPPLPPPPPSPAPVPAPAAAPTEVSTPGVQTMYPTNGPSGSIQYPWEQ